MSQSLKIQAIGLDPVHADPAHYRVELENEKVRILRVRYGPHEKSVMQGLGTLVEINLTVAHFAFTYPDGRIETIQGKAGQVFTFPPSERLPENLSDFPYEAIAIELK